jgi:hypothetical protein
MEKGLSKHLHRKVEIYPPKLGEQTQSSFGGILKNPHFEEKLGKNKHKDKTNGCILHTSIEFTRQ